ncbi:Mov34/MPN/PAD-1 family protein [Acinetobacter gyllenbergii]|uniref:Mov34/MPN/PAD-1 family protein n=1 Tax=Acinetobacter gyllenbergii TaxID=134534 RepID=UPI0021CFC36A|nr:Mov34/MPN/PAD-1 family protein [Acinetobacter gyllenbergii]MCU4581177.1 Mov34/MPN/PAD-1 family protein [Acinetobacter gyllenbergii]
MKYDLAWEWQWKTIDVHLKVARAVADVFFAHTQNTKENEMGGQLFIDTSMSNGLWLSLATPPHKDDRAGPTWLELDSNRCKQEIIESKEQGLILAGYWHTHAELIPNLSAQDLKSFREFSCKNIESLPSPLAIIVGNSTETSSIRAWSLQKNDFLQATLA